MKNKYDALVLFSYRSHKRGYIEMLFDRLNQAAGKHPMTLSRGSLSDLRIAIMDGRMTITESLTGRDLKDFDLIYFELWYKAPEHALAAALYAQRQGVPFFSRELLDFMPVTKTGELAKLADSGLPLPDSLITSRRELLKIFRKDPPFPYPLIIKAADGYGGNNNFLINDYQKLADVLENHKDLKFVVQRFIPNDCDYRCLVMGGEIVLVLKRTRDKISGSHLNNTSQGAEGEIVSLHTIAEAAQRDVLRAAQLLKRSEFAGVDLLFDSRTGRHYILEVNQTPQIEIGAETDAKMEALLSYMVQSAKKGKS